MVDISHLAGMLGEGSLARSLGGVKSHDDGGKIWIGRHAIGSSFEKCSAGRQSCDIPLSSRYDMIHIK